MLYPKIILAVLLKVNFLADFTQIQSRLFEKTCEKKRISGDINLRCNMRG
jgi:hypothetical protein